MTIYYKYSINKIECNQLIQLYNDKNYNKIQKNNQHRGFHRP